MPTIKKDEGKEKEKITMIPRFIEVKIERNQSYYSYCECSENCPYLWSQLIDAHARGMQTWYFCSLFSMPASAYSLCNDKVISIRDMQDCCDFLNNLIDERWERFRSICGFDSSKLYGQETEDLRKLIEKKSKKFCLYNKQKQEQIIREVWSVIQRMLSYKRIKKLNEIFDKREKPPEFVNIGHYVRKSGYKDQLKLQEMLLAFYLVDGTGLSREDYFLR